MADAFPVSGNIDATLFPHLLVDLHHQGATGSLKVNGPVHPKALYFRGGRVLFGSSNDPRDQLGAILIEAGKITSDQLEEVNKKVGPGNPLAKVLAESGFVNQRELGDSARVKVERILSDVLSWASGSFEFEDGVLPKGAVDLKLSTEKLLLAAVRRISDREFALRHLGGDMGVILVAAPDGDAALTDVRAEVWALLERLDGTRTLQDAVALTRLDEFEAAKIACALLFLGIVVRKDGKASGELDLAEQALSGLGPDGGESPEPADSSTEPEAPSAIVPSEVSFGALDAESESEPGLPTAFPEPDQPLGVVPDEPLGIAPDEPVGVAPEEPLGVAPDEPLGVATDEPLGVAPDEPVGIAPEEPPAPGAEPTGFSFSEDAPAARADASPPDSPASADEPPLFSGEPPPPMPPPSFVEEPVIEAPAPAAEPEVPSFAFDPPSEAPVPSPEPEVPSFAMEPPAREGIDTVPGDRATVAPEAEAEQEIHEAEPLPEIPIAPLPPSEPSDTAPPPDGVAGPVSGATARPSQEDLAALDALLDPSASGTRASAASQPRAEGWEPHFPANEPSSTHGPSATTRRAIGRQTKPSRAPLIAFLATLVVVGVAAGYYLLGRTSLAPEPEPATTPSEAAPTPALSAPVTVAAAPSPMATPSTAPTTGLDPATAAGTTASLPPADVAPPPAAPEPTPTPDPAPTPVPQPPPSSGTDGLALLRQGSFDASASAFAASLAANAQNVYSIQVLAACSPDTIRKAAEGVAGDDIFILPVTLNGRACYRIGWGRYLTREDAEAGVRDLPSYFRQPGVKPRIQPLVELLP